MLFRRTPHLLRRKPRFRHAGWFLASLPAPSAFGPPEIDDPFVDPDGFRWRVVQIYIDEPGASPEWAAALVRETDYWRPLKGSGMVWQPNDETHATVITSDHLRGFTRQ